MTILWFDSETYSECDLKSAGTHAYASHPTTEIIVAQWAVDDGEPEVLDCTLGTDHRIYQLMALLEDPTILVYAHNSAFDRAVLRHVWGIDVPIERWRDTMVQALAHGLPGGLGAVGAVLGLEEDQAKDKRGRDLIHLFCKPRPKNMLLRRATRETHPKEWAEFLEYSRQDIVSMRAIAKKMPAWNYPGNPRELALWQLDQRINDRGFAVDTDLAEKAVRAAGREKKRLKAEIVEATDGAVTSASKRDVLLKYILEAHGVALPDMKVDTLRRRADDPELPEAVRVLINIRLEDSKASVSKYSALLRSVSGDGRLRNTSQFCGASRTGRWAHRLFQPGNLKRPDMKAHEIQDGIDALLADSADFLFDDVMNLCANAVRGCIVAPSGRKVVVADLANIEGRGVAALAGEEWKLQAFRDYDAGVGPDLYKLAYARSFNVDPSEAVGFKRQLGKVQELACFTGDTPVLTGRGWVKLTSVTKGDRVWDGETWVAHEGLLARGARKVVRVAGIGVTPDHLIAVQKTWRPAAQLVSSASTLSQALATGLENLPSSASTRAPLGVRLRWSLSRALAALPRIWPTTTTYAKGQAPDAARAGGPKALPPGRSSGPTPTSCPTKKPAGVCSSGSALALSVAGPMATTTTGPGASTSRRSGSTIGGLFCGTWWGSPVGTTRLLSLIASVSRRVMSRVTSALSRTARTVSTSAQYALCRPGSTSWKPTFDILNAGPRHRFTVLTAKGPLLVHNCGYEGGVAAYLTMAATYNLDLDELADAVHSSAPKEALAAAYKMHEWTLKKGLSTHGLSTSVWTACETLKAQWRAAHPAIVGLWAAAKDGFVKACANPGKTVEVGEHLRMRVDGSWLRLRLPSGRYLCYLQPKVKALKDGRLELSYLGVDQYTKQWGRIKTYSGKLVENATQAWARDVLAWNMPAVEEAGYAPLLTIHDELLTETPDTAEYTAEKLAALMTRPIPWAKDVPLSAAGFETYRYRKGD